MGRRCSGPKIPYQVKNRPRVSPPSSATVTEIDLTLSSTNPLPACSDDRIAESLASATLQPTRVGAPHPCQSPFMSSTTWPMLTQ